ncbi:RNA polymerase sigma factor [Paenibacillus mesophilus]|uniref:RNA polymerase sigma factor n=1 Tax=Paenibacillus mesophilus TaxID=2582849 RepID=UPI00110E5DC7|nr:RNA polymerase sigma factor [Paenibacillus mesophilus]TMV48195.1 RNA polymerase sigma factor [Paenibacillus mesophilus]
MHSDERFACRARNGDEDAFVALFRLYHNVVISVAYRIVRDGYAAQDIAQKVFIKAFRKLSALENSHKAYSWLYTMTKRTAIDWLRYQRRQPSILHDRCDVGADPFLLEDDYIRKEQKLLLGNALSRLDRPHRAAVILHDLRGYTAKEISAMTQESTNTIDSRIRRARQKLRKELAPHTADRIVVPVRTPWLDRRTASPVHNPEFEKHLVKHSILAVMLHMKRTAG